jgi:tetratricopeptide (TPR) repeat protein
MSVSICTAICANVLLAALAFGSSHDQAPSSIAGSRPAKDDCEKRFEQAMSPIWGTKHAKINEEEGLKRLKALAGTGCAEALAQLASVGCDGSWAPLVPENKGAAQDLGQLALAVGLAQRAEEGRPNAQYGLSKLYEYGLGFDKNADKAWQLAVAAAEGGSPAAQLYVGTKYYNPSDRSGKDPAKAASWYEQAAAQGLADAQFFLGVMYLKGVGVAKDINKAEELFQLAAKQGNEQALVRSVAFNSIRRYDRLLSQEPGNADIYYNRANSYYQLEQFDKAIEDCDRAITMNPEHHMAYIYRGGAYLELEQYDKAIQDYNSLVALKPDNDWSYRGRATARLEQGDFQNALADANKANQLSPSNDNAELVGLAYVGLKMPDKAIDILSRLQPIDSSIATGLSLAYQMKGDKQQAQQYRQQARAAEDYTGNKDELNRLQKAIIGTTSFDI